MNRKLKDLIVKEILEKKMPIEQAVEYIWELKEEDLKNENRKRT